MSFSPVDGCDGLHVNHKNGIRSDNRLENLEWCTNAYNRLHSYRVLKRRNPMEGRNGGLHPNAVPVVGRCIATGEIRHYASLADTAEDGFKRGDVSSCLTGAQKSHRGWLWRYASDPVPADWGYQPGKGGSRMKPIVGIAPDGTERRYAGAALAKADGFNPVAIGHVLKGRNETHNGYRWKFDDGNASQKDAHGCD